MYEQLCADYKGLVFHVANRYRNICSSDRGVDIDDLVQLGYIGLISAAQTYDSQRNSGTDGGKKSFAAWAYWHIATEYRDAFGTGQNGRKRAHTNTAELDAPIVSDDLEGTRAVDMLADDRIPDFAEYMERLDTVRIIQQCVGALDNDGRREVVKRLMLHGESTACVAATMGLTIAEVNSLKGKGIRSLSHDRRLRLLVDLDAETRFHAHKGVAAFFSDQTSVVEAAVIWRDNARKSAYSRILNTLKNPATAISAP